MQHHKVLLGKLALQAVQIPLPPIKNAVAVYTLDPITAQMNSLPSQSPCRSAMLSDRDSANLLLAVVITLTVMYKCSL